MRGVLGGFKNMLRQWRWNLKKKKQKEKSKIKLTRYPRLTSFVYSTIAIIYSPFGYIFTKHNNLAKQEKPVLYKKINSININLDQIIIGKKSNSELKQIEKEITKIKKEISQPMSNETRKYFANKINEVEIKAKFITNPTKTSSKEIKIVSDSLEKSVQKKNVTIPLNVNNDLITKLSLTSISLSRSKKIEKKNLTNSTPKLGNQGAIEFIKSANKELSNIEFKIKEVEQKIPTVKEYKIYYDLENDLKYFHSKIYDLKRKYEEFKTSFNFELEINIDKYKLTKSNDKINEMIELIDYDLNLIEENKKKMLTKKVVTEKKVEVKNKEEKKSKNEQKVKEVDEFIKAKDYVLNNIINQNKYLENYFKQLNKSINKKKTFFSSILRFSQTVLNFTISLLPISVFKNKLLGTLVSSIMINNSIKTMRKMTNPNYHINYEIFLEKYMDNKEIINNTYNICNNSLDEIRKLKDDLMVFEQNKELKEILTKIDMIEDKIIDQIEKLKLKDRSLDKIYIKIKKAA